MNNNQSDLINELANGGRSTLRKKTTVAENEKKKEILRREQRGNTSKPKEKFSYRCRKKKHKKVAEIVPVDRLELSRLQEMMREQECGSYFPVFLIDIVLVVVVAVVTNVVSGKI